MPRKKTTSRRPRVPAKLKSFLEKAKHLGAVNPRIIPAPSVETAQWVRLKCRFGCGGHGSSLCCPPYSPTPEITRQVLDEFKWAILFESGRGRPKSIVSELERELFLSGYYKAFGIGAGPCRLCKKGCAFEKGCRHPDQARPSMEACGIDVYGTVRKHGFKIEVVKDYDQPQHYFGLMLVE